MLSIDATHIRVKNLDWWRLCKSESEKEKRKMNYITTRAIEFTQHNYRMSHYTQRYIAPKLPDYTARFLPRYERDPAAETMEASYFVYRVEQEALRRLARKKARQNSYLSLSAAAQAFAEKEHKEKEEGWVRFLEPIAIYSNQHKKVEIEKPKKVGYELIELKNPGTHREFLIREKVTCQLVKWDDLPVGNIVWEYIKRHGFPEDKYYSEEDFLNDVKNRSSEIFLCVESRETADFVLKLCHGLIGRFTSYSSHCKGVDQKWMNKHKSN